MIDQCRYVRCVNLLEETKSLCDKIKGASEFSSTKQTGHFDFSKAARRRIIKLKTIEFLLSDERLLHLDENASFKIRRGDGR